MTQHSPSEHSLANDEQVARLEEILERIRFKVGYRGEVWDCRLWHVGEALDGILGSEPMLLLLDVAGRPAHMLNLREARAILDTIPRER